MKEKKPFSVIQRIKSFRFAFAGIKMMWKMEHNFRIHLFAALAAITMAIIFDIEAWKWFALLVCIVIVLVAEIFNTAIEKLCNLVEPNQHPQVKIIKDISAAAVLIAALLAVVAAVIIFCI